MSVDYKVRQIYNVVIKEVTETQESWKSVLRLAGQIYRCLLYTSDAADD